MMQFPKQRALVDINNAWNELAPKADQGFVWKLVAEMRADGSHDEVEQCRQAISRLYDGLTYGNWPSTIRGEKA